MTALTRADVYELLREYVGADLMRRTYHGQGDDEAAKREEDHARKVSEAILDAFDARAMAGMGVDLIDRVASEVYRRLSGDTAYGDPATENHIVTPRMAMMCVRRVLVQTCGDKPCEPRPNGADAERDAGEKRQREIAERIADAVDTRGPLAGLDDDNIDAIGNWVYSRLWNAAGYDDPKQTNHVLTPTMAMMAVKSVLKHVRDGARPMTIGTGGMVSTKENRATENTGNARVDGIRGLLRNLWDAAQRQRSSEHDGDQGEAKRQGEIGQGLERQILAQFGSCDGPHAETDTAWALDRLKTIATAGDDAISQAHACEAIIRSVRTLAGGEG